MMLDDIVGFVGEPEFREFGYPYLKELYDVDAKVKLFHNDADCAMSVKYYPELGINLFNPGTQMTVKDLIDVTGSRLTILGNIPPRDILAAGTPPIIAAAVKDLLDETPDHRRLILSCGGGMPPGVSSRNLHAFIRAARS
jgi:uroporphyrinogen decarboxylase